MWRHFQAKQLIRTSPQRVFDFVADHRNVKPLLQGVTRWEPIGSKSQGKGATYKVEISALGLTLGDKLQLDRWEPPRSIGWHSVGGVMAQRGRWLFTPRDGAVEAELRIDYDPPAGLLGNAMARPIEALVQRRVRQALKRMRERVEAADRT